MKLFLLLLVATITFNVSAQLPVIISVTSGFGPVDTTVTIEGINFSSNLSDNIVYFGAVKANIINSSSSEITTTVPAGATYSPITVINNNYIAYSEKPFIQTFQSGGNLNSASFANQTSLPAELYPRSLVSGDFNVDGKPDLIAVNNNSNSLSVFKNKSTLNKIVFKNVTGYQTGTTPFYITSGDFNNDGLLDIVVSNYGENTISVYKNKSNINTLLFATPVKFATAESPEGLAIADIDKDGKNDIIVVNNNGYSISVFRNISSATKILFEAKKDFATGTWPFFVVAADFNKDGLPDVAVTNHDDNTISIFKNTSTKGNISFAAKQDYAAGLNPFGITAGDINEDGKPDIIATNSNDGTISVFRNKSTGDSIIFSEKKDFISGVSPLSVKLNDLNGDAKPDMIVVNFNEDSVTVFQNTSTNNSISFKQKIKVSTEHLPREVVLGDLNGDGKPDMATVNSGSNDISILKNQMGEATFNYSTAEIYNKRFPANVLNISVKPNPVSTQFSIEINTAMPSQQIQITITDGSGKAVLSEKKTLLKGNNSFTYNTSSWAAGVYDITMVFANGIKKDIKVIKQ